VPSLHRGYFIRSSGVRSVVLKTKRVDDDVCIHMCAQTSANPEVISLVSVRTPQASWQAPLHSTSYRPMSRLPCTVWRGLYQKLFELDLSAHLRCCMFCPLRLGHFAPACTGSSTGNHKTTQERLAYMLTMDLFLSDPTPRDRNCLQHC
jgi:hypothetical protein